MSTRTQRRVAAGVREGGQFTQTERGEADVRLDAAEPGAAPPLTDTQREALVHLARRRRSWPSSRNGIYQDDAPYTEKVLRRLVDLGLARYVQYPFGSGVMPHFEATFEVTPADGSEDDWSVDLPAAAASFQIAAAVVRGHLCRARGKSSFYQPPRVRIVGTEPTASGGTRYTVRAGAER